MKLSLNDVNRYKISFSPFQLIQPCKCTSFSSLSLSRPPTHSFYFFALFSTMNISIANCNEIKMRMKSWKWKFLVFICNYSATISLFSEFSLSSLSLSLSLTAILKFKAELIPFYESPQFSLCFLLILRVSLYLSIHSTRLLSLSLCRDVVS
jgi:hypothetical protein